jgi:hypothetical protein
MISGDESGAIFSERLSSATAPTTTTPSAGGRGPLPCATRSSDRQQPDCVDMALRAGRRFIGRIHRTVDDIRLTALSATELISRHKRILGDDDPGQATPNDRGTRFNCGVLATAKAIQAASSDSGYRHRMQVLLTRRRHVDNMRVASSFCR